MARHHMTVNGPVPFTPEEEAEWDKQEAEYAALEGDRKAKEVRDTRNYLLAETDWWMLPDNNQTQAQISYRQALRDLPQQEGFPFNIEWPVKP